MGAGWLTRTSVYAQKKRRERRKVGKRNKGGKGCGKKEGRERERKRTKIMRIRQ
jgi:hypothetical protein